MRIKNEVENTIVINKSEFITYLSKCKDEASCREFIDFVRKLHPQANHVCTAYITNNKRTMKTSDDGEPAKTAGMPMLDALVKNDMEDICACVVRYFGGIKLGAGGLVRAYSNSVSEAIKKAGKVEVVFAKIYKLTFGYDMIDKLNYWLKDFSIMEKNYEEKVSYILFSETDIEKQLIEWCNGRIEIEYLGEKEVEKEVNYAG